MRNFCLFVALILFFLPSGGPDVMDYFDDATYEFCTYEQPPEGADAVDNGVFWEVRADSANRREVFGSLGEVKAVSVTVRDFDRERFFRDFRVTVQSVQELPDVTIYYCRSFGESMQIAVREDFAKIGVPALLNSY